MMPPGIEQAYLFQVFNTISWQIVQGLPISLFFKFMGASDTVLGLVASLNPLMMLLQIPAASHLERIGYRNFALRGWALRTIFVAAIAIVSLLLFLLDRTTCMMLTLFLLFIYSTLRGISTCAFLPWITQLVPEKIRGNYLSRDQMFSALAGLVTILGMSALLYPRPTNFSFSLAFLISFAGGLASLGFLRRMPDVPVPPTNSNGEAVPWAAMLFHPPFFKLLRYDVVINSVLAVSTVFWMPMLRTNFHWSDSQILALSAFSILVSTGVLWFFGRMIDRVGSLPLLHLAAWIQILHLSGWLLAACRLVPFSPLLIVFIGLTGGVGPSLFNLANTRLVMATVPEMGRSHFFALYSVANSLVLGLWPIIWGVVLDALRGWHWVGTGFDFDHYSLLFSILIVLMLCSFPWRRVLTEDRSLSSEEFYRELLVKTPGRAITRLLRGRPDLNQ